MQIDDADLVVRAQLGDRRALTALVERWHLPVWRYVRRMLDAPGPADDVSQEAWAAVLRALPRLREPDRFAPWLFTIVRRSLMNHLRRRYAPAEPPPPDEGTVDSAHLALDRAEVEDGLAGVPPREREVLVLFYLHDLALDDCAQILGVPAGTVKSRLHRARLLLRDHLVAKGYDS
ncbi:RNA polymerase sigma factor [Actinoplanes sp. NPDC051494]|uniref:RNA polymerase sigma factor n=1 Tax=Actinoplanes sp. NPDC051494 TaxID=3363907 RepID=UPI0037AA2102